MTDTQTPEPEKKPIWTRWWMIVIYVIVGLGIIGSLAGDDTDGEPIAGEATTTTEAEESETTEPEATTTSEATTTTSTTTIPVTTTTTVPEPTPAFGNGTQIIGEDVQPGIYETGLVGDSVFTGCYWERLSGLSGEFDDIIANNNVVYHDIVEILETDVAFSSDCGEWYELPAAEDDIGPFERIPQGKWIVNVHIAPGIYEAPGSDECYWERLSGLTGTFEDIIANGLPTDRAIVEIQSGDLAFNSFGCGEWTQR